MLVKWKRYRLLDGSEKTSVQKVGDGSIIRRFEKTPYPQKPNDVVCPHFLELAWSWGCPYDCSFCYLKGTFRFSKDEKTGRILPHFKDRDQVKKACETFIYEVQEPEILNAGELSDSLMGENLRPVSWSVFIQGIFEGSPHKILHLTKGDNVKNFLEHEWQKNAILSWSANEPEVSRTWEKLAPDPFKRLDAAKKVSDAGYEVRLRIDPIVPVMDFKQRYRRFIDEIFKRDLQPERTTLGTLRGLPSTLAHVKNHSWESFLNKKSGMSSWGYKPRFEARLEMYQDLIEYLKQHGVSKIGVCKDTLKLWNTLGLQFDRIRCNCIA